MQKEGKEAIKAFPNVNEDVFEPYLNKRVVLNVSWSNRPIFGTLTKIGDPYISILRKAGRITKIRQSSILAIDLDAGAI